MGGFGRLGSLKREGEREKEPVYGACVLIKSMNQNKKLKNVKINDCPG